MGALNPLFLAAAAAVAVPLVLHLLHRRVSRRVAFPALRYLQRTELEHARRIRLRQLLLLLLRVAVVLLVVGAGARLFLRSGMGTHPPTALVVVVDNSLSSSLVRNGIQVLEELKATSLRSLRDATPGDRIWVLRAGEPWEAAYPSSPEEARRRIRETTPSAGRGDLGSALERAADLVREAELPAREIHLLSDLQASALPTEASVPEDLPVLVLAPRDAPPPNRYVSLALVGGGLPPVENQPAQVAARVEVSGGDPDEVVPVRLVVDGTVRDAGEAPAGEEVLLSLGPLPAGAWAGWVETDPDQLRGDDRRHLTFRVRAPPAVAVVGGRAFYVDQALAVLAERGRIRRSGPSGAGIVVALGGAGLDSRAEGVPAVVLPPPDPSLFPALNRRLAAAGIPWRYERAGDGETRIRAGGVPVDLGAVRVRASHRLRPVRGGIGPGEVRLRLATGQPWLVTGPAPGGPYLLLASPLDPEATTLPVSAAMIPLMEWIVGRWAPGTSRPGGFLAGNPLPLPTGATHVRDPEGTLHPVDGTQTLRATRTAGVHVILRGDSVLDRVAVNPPIAESRLERGAIDDLGDRIGGRVTVVEDPSSWSDATFTRRQGPELWMPFLSLALVLLLIESWVAAAGRRGGRSVTESRPSRAQVS